jgi:hypothetical protein
MTWVMPQPQKNERCREVSSELTLPTFLPLLNPYAWEYSIILTAAATAEARERSERFWLPTPRCPIGKC